MQSVGHMSRTKFCWSLHGGGASSRCQWPFTSWQYQLPSPGCGFGLCRVRLPKVLVACQWKHVVLGEANPRGASLQVVHVPFSAPGRSPLHAQRFATSNHFIIDRWQSKGMMWMKRRGNCQPNLTDFFVQSILNILWEKKGWQPCVMMCLTFFGLNWKLGNPTCSLFR